MLTRRSRKDEAVTSPNDSSTPSKSKRSNTPSIGKRSATPSKSKGSATPSKSKRSTTPSKSKRSTTPSKSKRSTTPSKNKRAMTPRRSKSKSIERVLRRPRADIANKPLPQIILQRVDMHNKNIGNKNDTKKIKSVKPGGLNLNKSPVKDEDTKNNYFIDEINNFQESKSTSSRLIYESDDESELKKKKIVKLPVEFGGTFGNIILTLLLPILVVLAKIALKTKGNLIPFPRGYLRFSNYYDQDVFIWTAAIVFIQLLVSLIPLARKTGLLNSNKLQYYRFSGFMNLIVGVLIVAAMNYFKCPINYILDIVTKKTVPHVIVSVLCALIISIILYVKAKLAKQIDELNSLNFLQKWFIGTTNYSTLGPINIKLALYRYSVLMTILFNYLVIVDSLKNPVNINLYVVAGLQIFYALYKLVFEFYLLSSFFLQKEKDGFWTIIQQLLKPIIHFLPIQILFATNLPVNNFILSISILIFLLGFVCQHYGDYIKYWHATNLHRVVTINTKYYNIFSYIKYPNYIGTIMVHLAFILPTIELNLISLQSCWPVFLYPMYYIVTLSHRCARVNNYYALNYDYFWQNQYEGKWNLIPKIY